MPTPEVLLLITVMLNITWFNTQLPWPNRRAHMGFIETCLNVRL